MSHPNHYAEQSLVNAYREAALAAGLAEVDGYGGRCVLGGSTCQWRSLKKALTAWPASDCLTTAIARIEWAIAECRAPSAE